MDAAAMNALLAKQKAAHLRDGEPSAQVRAERSKECSELRRNLSQIERDGRYFTTDANGERTYIDVKEVEAARSRLSSRIAQRCG